MRRSLLATMAMQLALVVGCGDSGTTGGSGGSGGGGGSGANGGSGGSGASGGSSGEFMDNSSSNMMGCDPQTFTLEQAPPPEVYLVVDRSGSMLAPGADPLKTRWQELKDAIIGAVTQYEASIHFGLIMYPNGTECGTSGPQAIFAANNKTAIQTKLDATTPAGGTPTAAALNNAAESLTELGTVDSTKILILATDGGPNCNYFLNAEPECACNFASSPEFCCTNYPAACPLPSACLDDSGSLSTITDLHNQGLDTFVIGLAGTEEYTDLLDAMAIAGGRPQMNAATSYYAAADEASLQAALNTIAVSVISCVIPLTEAPEEPDAVTVYVDGQEIPHDDGQSNGWDYTDDSNTAIEIFGPACTTLQDGATHDVTATFDCEVT